MIWPTKYDFYLFYCPLTSLNAFFHLSFYRKQNIKSFCFYPWKSRILCRIYRIEIWRYHWRIGTAGHDWFFRTNIFTVLLSNGLTYDSWHMMIWFYVTHSLFSRGQDGAQLLVGTFAGAVSIFGPDALPVVHQWLLRGLEPATSRVRVAAHNH